jgi:hypothetical protein
MTYLYTYADLDGDVLTIDHGTYANGNAEVEGVHFITLSGGNVTSAVIPDDEIPGLVSALQNYMSKRAKEIAKAAAR